MGITARKSGIAAAFTSSLTKNLSDPTAASAVLQAYNIAPTTPDDDAVQGILAFANDIAYYLPARSYAKSWPGKTYYYHFDEPNPWDGAFKGCSTHLLDAVFLFQAYNEKLSDEAKEVAIAMARRFIRFANGDAPWKEFHKDIGGVQRFGPSGVSTETFVEGYGGTERRDVLLRLNEEGVVDLDQVSAAWDLFVAGQ
jgi:carboxylesterase type B